MIQLYVGCWAEGLFFFAVCWPEIVLNSFPCKKNPERQMPARVRQQKVFCYPMMEVITSLLLYPIR